MTITFLVSTFCKGPSILQHADHMLAAYSMQSIVVHNCADMGGTSADLTYTHTQLSVLELDGVDMQNVCSVFSSAMLFTSDFAHTQVQPHHLRIFMSLCACVMDLFIPQPALANAVITLR